MQKITLVTLVFCLSAMVVQAQSLPINVSYFGETGIHPGLKVGVEYGLWEKEKTKNRWLFNRNDKIGPKVKTKELFAAGNLGFYNHANNHTGIFTTAEIGYRRTKHRKGSFLETSLGIGYLQRIYNVNTFEAGSTEPFTGGQGQFLTTFSVGFGRDLSFKRDLPISWYVKPNLLLARQAHTFVPNAALELGVCYKL